MKYEEWTFVNLQKCLCQNQQRIPPKAHMNIIQNVKYGQVERSKGDEVISLPGYPRKKLGQDNSTIAAT